MNRLHQALLQSGNGVGKGVFSVCSANEYVLRAAMEHARHLDIDVLIEATSNQVDQFGGYTGMTPPEFRDWVHGLAQDVGYAADRVILGGDHLGPNAWQHLPAAVAMGHARTLIAAYVSAGFEKIHLDCSMRCGDDPAVLPEAVIAERAAELCEVAEATARAHGCQDNLCYVIGTEVPVPGGETSLGEGVAVTAANEAEATLAAHALAFQARGLHDAWERIVALVVQPGVDFDHTNVQCYQPAAAVQLAETITRHPNIVYEAHSTDYQPGAALAELVRDRFAILKVGPALTYALREAWFALSAIEEELLPPEQRARLPDVLDRRMVEQPRHWKKYYAGDAIDQRLLRRFSFSDRSRYYWLDSEVAEALRKLLANLGARHIPLSLLSQYLPEQFHAVLEGRLRSDAVQLAMHRVKMVLDRYALACRLKPQ